MCKVCHIHPLIHSSNCMLVRVQCRKYLTLQEVPASCACAEVSVLWDLTYSSKSRGTTGWHRIYLCLIPSKCELHPLQSTSCARINQNKVKQKKREKENNNKDKSNARYSPRSGEKVKRSRRSRKRNGNRRTSRRGAKDEPEEGGGKGGQAAEKKTK